MPRACAIRGAGSRWAAKGLALSAPGYSASVPGTLLVRQHCWPPSRWPGRVCHLTRDGHTQPVPTQAGSEAGAVRGAGHSGGEGTPAMPLRCILYLPWGLMLSASPGSPRGGDSLEGRAAVIWPKPHLCQVVTLRFRPSFPNLAARLLQAREGWPWARPSRFRAGSSAVTEPVQ